jgi:hypothetical protein
VVLCSGTADGDCGGVDFFYNDRYVGMLDVGMMGKLTIFAYNARIFSQNGRTVVMDLPLSRSSDGLCCPSGGTLTARFAWNGHAVVPIGPTATSAPTPGA